MMNHHMIVKEFDCHHDNIIIIRTFLHHHHFTIVIVATQSDHHHKQIWHINRSFNKNHFIKNKKKTKQFQIQKDS